MKFWWLKPVSEFAAGVARSLVEEPLSWDFDLDKRFIVNQEASLGISIQDMNFGLVTTLSPNSGTNQIEQFKGVDWRAFRKAFRQWRALTAPERRRISERRKRLALEALGRTARSR